MSTPSVAGFAAANWQGTAALTRTYLQGTLVAEDIDNSVVLPGYDDTTAGFDTSTGYGLPRTGYGTNGFAGATVQASVAGDGTVGIDVTGPGNANYRIGVSSPSGDWTYAGFTTETDGTDALTLTPWTDPGTWLLTVDFGGGATDFGAAFDTFVQSD